MNIRLAFITETEKARLYQDRSGEQFWIPRSVISKTLKFPAKDLNAAPVHELTIEDWWWDKKEGVTDDYKDPDDPELEYPWNLKD